MVDRDTSPGSWKHPACVVGGYTVLFCWLHARSLFGGRWPVESDLYEQFLPAFLSPITTWSSFEFGGAPAFADPGEAALYPLQLLFAHVLHSWPGFIVSAFVLAASGTYAYVFSLTRSRAGAALAGLAFGLSEAMTGRVAHLTTLHTVAWLPLIALAIDQVRGPRPWRWMALGAVIVGNAVLAGNPQTLVYAAYPLALYAVVGLVVERASPGGWLATAGAVGLGALLAAVKALPVVEVSQYTARQEMSLGAFYRFANTPAEMLSALLPTILHDNREAPTYVGLVTLTAAMAATSRAFREWRVLFWLGIGTAAALIAMGPATPLAAWAFELPGYDKFRVGARHLIQTCLAASMLAGFGVAWLRDNRLHARAFGVSAVLVCTAVAAAIGAVHQRSLVIPVGQLSLTHFETPLLPFDEWIQGGLAVASCAAALALARRPSSRLRLATLAGVLALDLVRRLDTDAAGLLDPGLPPALVEQPSVHVASLAQGLAPLHQRLLLPEGSNQDDVLPGLYARLWQVPSAGGYGPMLLSAYQALSNIGTNGAVGIGALADDNAALDVMAVRYVVMPRDWLAPPSTVDRAGTFSAEPIGLTVGPTECGQSGPRTAAFALPAGVRARTVLLSTFTRCSDGVPQGQAVARVRVVGDEGVGYDQSWRMGIDTADGSLGDPRSRERARHQPATLFEPVGQPQRYLAKLELAGVITNGRLEVELTGLPGWLVIDHLSVVDVDGTTSAQSAAHAYVDDRRRWRPAAAFATHRYTDRGRDESRADEREFVAFENSRAMPRAWVARELVALSPAAVLAAVHHSRLPGGRPFVPRLTSLTSDDRFTARTFGDAGGTARVAALDDGHVQLRVSTGGGGVLVLSESAYPGWTARVGTTPLEVFTVNGALLAAVVPPGEQVVDFEFRSASLRLGATLSLLGALAVGAVLLLSWRGRQSNVAAKGQRP